MDEREKRGTRDDRSGREPMPAPGQEPTAPLAGGGGGGAWPLRWPRKREFPTLGISPGVGGIDI